MYGVRTISIAGSFNMPTERDIHFFPSGEHDLATGNYASIVNCSHWIDCGITGGGCCSIGEYERPSLGVCLQVCTAYDGPARGAGDLLAKAIKTVTLGKVKPCGGCKGRQTALNRALPRRVK